MERATPTQGERVLAEAAEAYCVALGDRLLAAYALGSVAHGGFSELVSDIDLVKGVKTAFIQAAAL